MEENNNGSMTHIRNWSRSRCEDELASIRYSILSKVQRMCRDWEAIAELNKRKERVEIRLEEMGVNLKKLKEK